MTTRFVSYLLPRPTNTGDMEPSSSLPAKLETERKSSTRLKSSASVEARISTAQHRVRTGNSPGISKVGSQAHSDLENNASTTLGTLVNNWFLVTFSPSDSGFNVRHRLAQNSRLRFSLAVYCILCMLFLSSKLYSRLPLEQRSMHTELKTCVSSI